MSLKDIILSSKEEDSQAYLAAHPQILLSAFAKQWDVNELIPKFRFGTEFVSDFVIVSGQSFSYSIYLIELEPPTINPFNKDGIPSQRLNKAMGQIYDWLDWIRKNEGYFKESLYSKMDNEYGKEQIRSSRRFFVSSKIIIGQRNHMTEKDNHTRATIREERKLEIVPYDRLVDIEEKCANHSWP